MTADKNTVQDTDFMIEGATHAAALLRTLGNERRLLMLCFLIDRGEMSVSALGECVGLSQSALSQHLAKMRDEGLVSCRREAQNVYYRVADPKVHAMITSLKDIFCP